MTTHTQELPVITRLHLHKLRFYCTALDLVEQVDLLSRQLPRGRAYLRDQLQRVAGSVVANIAEGAGEFSPADKARFYRMALRSATETAALVDMCGRLEGIDANLTGSCDALLVTVVSMLTRLVLRFGREG